MSSKTKTLESIFEEDNYKTIDGNDLFHNNMKIYGIDVLEDRALADYRDGLKPAARRIVYAAQEMKATWNNKTVKSARLVGETMGKFHPHGDSGIESSLVTLVNQNYAPIHGQGNWGSLTDNAAATRYTECKLSPIGMKMLECNDVADYVLNYTGEYKEPVVIPSRFPNFFVNACAGIAVGLNCNIPSHNLKEIVGALKEVVKKGDKTTIKDLMKHIKGPDYKYGGHIISTPEEIANVYSSGEGSIKYECDYTLVPEKKNVLLTITGYCPSFNPGTFIDKMIKLIDEDVVIYVNDSSTKNELCKLEVLIKSEELFEKYVHKYLIKSESYRFYAIQREKSNKENKDIDTKILIPNMIDLMKLWIDWRKSIETKMCEKEKNIFVDKKTKANWKLLASSNLKIIVKALETNDPVKYVSENLPGTVTIECAKYILDQKIISLQKIDQDKTKNEIKEYDLKIKELENNIAHIDNVVLKELDNLQEFYKDRTLKI